MYIRAHVWLYIMHCCVDIYVCKYIYNVHVAKYTQQFLIELFPILTGPVMDPPQFLPAIISEHDVTVNECVVTLEWNEPFISCAGSVSQYVLTVIPPTSDCQSGSGDCVLMNDQTQYNLTVTVDQMYSLTVRADTCRNIQRGESSTVLTLELGG